MSDTMRTLPLRELLQRILREYRLEQSVFGLHESTWYRKGDSRTVDIMGETVETVLGPAAGPHTQLAQNIVASYLTGSRCIELKTVQILDGLELDKPCINAADEGLNTEWSTELTLQTAWEEYAKAWILLHVVEELWNLRATTGSGDSAAQTARSFMFTMSVGYDLAGIKNERMQQFLHRMTDSSREPMFHGWLSEVEQSLPDLLAGTPLQHKIERIPAIRSRISGTICRTVTLSTMHGCPPAEIEAICAHLLTEKNLETFVKLNPTLLGYDTVRMILDRLGYTYVKLDREGFSHDLAWDEALTILGNLRNTAEHAGRRFGVKLTNTLPTVNASDSTAGAGGRTPGTPLPGDQAYLSGRALYPLSITLAARLSREFDGLLPISYSGGITAHNVVDVFRTGIRPITTCTVLLKPGGYARQAQLAALLEKEAQWDYPRIDVPALSALAESALAEPALHKQFRGTDAVHVSGVLPRYDCYRAPCVEACPISQHVPEYIRLVGEGRCADALELIYEQNALPAITGHICDHACQHACTRLDYEGCVNIRELKKIAVRNGGEAHRGIGVPVTRETPCAVIGAGPAGLSAAYFLRREGYPVTVFERENEAGGVVRHVIPEFRLPQEAIEEDIDHIRRCGVDFRFGVAPDCTAETLRRDGFGPIVLAVGAEVDNELPLEGDRSRVIRSLDFLWTFRGNRPRENAERHNAPGRRVVVVGGGNTAMDAARAAMTLSGVEDVSVLYRRSEQEMPADREEYENARADGVRFQFLRNPERIEQDGTLTVRVMELGAPDSSGRRRPVPTDATETLTADTVIAAIGERVDTEMLRRFGVPLEESAAAWPIVNDETLETGLPGVYLAGDARTGPSTVVQCIAAGRRVADAIASAQQAPVADRPAGPVIPLEQRLAQLRRRKACITNKPDPTSYDDHRTFSAREYERCLECSSVCNRCVEVCPNRANITVPTVSEALFRDPFQIVHLDALCNECGNCSQFCPWTENHPYRDKPTVFSTRDDFENSTNEGWLLEADGSVRYRYDGAESVLAGPGGTGGTAGNTGDTGDTAAGRNYARDTAANVDGCERPFFRLLEILLDRQPELFRRLE